MLTKSCQDRLGVVLARVDYSTCSLVEGCIQHSDVLVGVTATVVDSGNSVEPAILNSVVDSEESVLQV